MNKLSDEQVYVIRAGYAEGISQNKLSQFYGVSRQNISLIVNGKRRRKNCCFPEQVNIPSPERCCVPEQVNIPSPERCCVPEQVNIPSPERCCVPEQVKSTPPSPGAFNLSLPTTVVENTENYTNTRTLTGLSIASRIRNLRGSY